MSTLNDFKNALGEAFNLIINFDNDLLNIVVLTLLVTSVSTVISSVLGIFLGVIIARSDFRFKSLIVRILSGFMGLPPVVVGLIVYALLSNKGPFGSARLLFTPVAMIFAQILIVLPLILSLTIAQTSPKISSLLETTNGIRVGWIKSTMLIISESRIGLFSVGIAGYGRAISEVGAVMLVGGNIENHTRVMTTSIILETSKGNYDKGLAIGIILILIVVTINIFVNRKQEVQ